MMDFKNTERKEHFMDIPQSYSSNKLYLLDSRRENTIERWPYGNMGKIYSASKELEITLNDLTSFQFVPSTKKLFTAIKGEFYGNHRDEIMIPITSYAKRCGRTCIKELRRSLDKDLKSLLQIQIPFEKSGPTQPLFLKAELQRGYIFVKLSQYFVDDLKKNRGAIQLPYLYFELSTKQYRFASDMLYYIALLRFLNNKDPARRDHITVEKLLDYTTLPSLSAVQKKKNGSVKERIMDPFFLNLNALHEELTYQLVNSRGFTISEEEARKLSYYEFRKICIHFSWVHEEEMRNYDVALSAKQGS